MVDPHVVMLVANDVERDTRVKKEALALARAGLRVTIVGHAPDGVRDERVMGPVRLIRVPVPLTVREGVIARRRRRRAKYPPLAFRTAAEAQAARLQWSARIYEAGADPAPRPVRLAKIEVAKALRGWVDVRMSAQGRSRDALTKAWKARDARRLRSTRGASWRRDLPEQLDWERALAPVLDALAPDVIHAHDVHTVGIAAHAAVRLSRGNRRVRWVYDSHEYVQGEPVYGRHSARAIAAWADLERQFVRRADAVVTVSPQIAQELQRSYRLKAVPTVVLNAPTAVAPPADPPSVRRAAGVDADTTLLVYSGNLTQVRGLEAMVDALVLLPEVHLALVVPHVINDYGQSLLDRAHDAGVSDRLHVVPPVDADLVSTYLSTATAAVHGLLRAPSHDFALPNKLFEYLQARLPLLTSDVPAMAAFVTEHGTGEVYRAGDAASLAEAARRLLPRLAQVRAAFDVPGFLEAWQWEPQADALRTLYAELLGRPTPALAPEGSLALRREADLAGPFVAIGPANMAGQGHEWARALERAVPGVRVEALQVEAGLTFPADLVVSADSFARDKAWQAERERTALRTWTHAVFEAGRPLLGTRHGKDFTADEALLSRHGVRTALVIHGSELRSPRRHRLLYQHSPFHDRDEPFFDLLQRKVDELAPLVARYDGPKLVATHDMLDEVPEASWLPIVVDLDRWLPGPEPLQRERPVVVHIPSNPLLKGSALIEPAVQALHDKGLIEYRRLDQVPPLQMPAVLADADVVLDHFVIGNYATLSIQAMAMGRVTVCHVADRVRARHPAALPVVDATPANIGEVLERIVAERDWARSVAAEGRAFATRWHDGTESGRVLAQALGLQ